MSEQGNAGWIKKTPASTLPPPQSSSHLSSNLERGETRSDYSCSSSDESSSSPQPYFIQVREQEDKSNTSRREGDSQTECWTTTEEEQEEDDDQEDNSTDQVLEPLISKVRKPKKPLPAPVKAAAVAPRLTATQSLQHYRSRFTLKSLLEGTILRLHHNTQFPGRASPIRRQFNLWLLKMFVFIGRYQRELCILFLLFATGFASFRSGPIKTRSTPLPKPFFTGEEARGDLLDDYYRGDYVHLVQNKIPQSPSFVFYYAPWDSESVASKSVFRNVAEYFHRRVPGQVRFYAVNCWWPEGECRKNYKNLSHFPIFVAHLEKNAGIIYSGPIREELIIKFLNSLLKPITRIDTEEEMWRFRAKHDAIMLGYFNFTDSESSQAYETYLQMALRNFEADPFGQVGFGVFLKYELAEKFFLTSSNVISLVLFNEIHTAKWTGDRHTQGARGPVGQVANWVIERTKKGPITWAYQVRSGFANRPVALGPVDLADEVRKGPVILLITRRYFPSSYSPFYAQVKEVALDYFNCNKSGNVTKLRRIGHKLNSEWLSLWNSVSRVCSGEGVASAATGINPTCSVLTEQLKHWRTKKKALKRESLANYESIVADFNFTGFACESERQFKFLAVDPVDIPHFPHLAMGALGYTNNTDPILFLIDAQNEMVLPVMSFNITTLAQLIYRYTREVESGEDSSTTGLIWSLEGLQQGQMTKRSNVNIRNDVITSTKKNPVISITSEDLVKYLSGTTPYWTDSNSGLFLMFTAKFCGQCGVSLGHFLQLSTFLSEHYELGLNVTFAKLDMFKNSLPPELRPMNLPTFVYFPAQKGRSRVFDISLVPSTKNLLRFLLAELEPENRVQLSLQSPGCNGPKLGSTGQHNCQNKSDASGDLNCSLSLPPGSSSSRNGGLGPDGLRRKNCVNVNRVGVTQRIHEMLEGIQSAIKVGGGVGASPSVWGASSAEDSSLRPFSLDKLMTEDLEHLRSMKIRLEVS